MRERNPQPAKDQTSNRRPVNRPAAAAVAGAGQLMAVQRSAGNQAATRLVQRLLDGFYNDGKTKVPKERIALSDAFKKKHVAADEGKARAVTGARIDSGKPPSMVQGRLANTVATEADWLAAIDASTATIPDQDNWAGDMAIALNGWEAKRTGPRSITVTALNAGARTIGGYMKKQGGAVTVDHVSGQKDS